MDHAGHELADALSDRLQAERIETHISWVLLSGDFAWKIKKPVHLPFVDYSTLAARRRCCEEELRLNRRLAPALYLGVTPITGTPQAPVMNGDGPVIDYALKMRRFATGALFSEGLEAGRLTAQEIDDCAHLLAHFHLQAPSAPIDSPWGDPQQRIARAIAALQGARAIATQQEYQALDRWIREETAGLLPLWAQRRAAGAVREVHGDLHLANLVRLPEGVAAFDGIEFDPALRWIDVIDDIAFAVMDLHAGGRPDFAFRLLNGWLDGTGQHDGLPALRFAVVYRALVRAQVEHMQAHDARARACLATALHWMRPAERWLAITHGLPGSGKTWASQRWLERHGAIRLRSDVERKRLFGLGPTEDSRSRGLDIYGPDATARTYARALALARIALEAGYPAILDAAFLRLRERRDAAALARALGVPFRILHCEAPPAVLRERLRSRHGDASEADEKVLEHLAEAEEPLAADELACVEAADTAY